MSPRSKGVTPGAGLSPAKGGTKRNGSKSKPANKIRSSVTNSGK